MPELAKTYEAARVQEHWTAQWEASGLFTAGQRPGAPTWTCMIPPPNVTSVLHMGHALNAVVQDILVRWRRMMGDDVLWLPGTDHAGIATQAVVEKKLWNESKRTRHDLGREAFVERVWEWKEEYGNLILQQFRSLGCSCDWTRTSFTMDENLSRAVRVSFVKLWEKGLVYRGTRMVNWDCVLRSAVGDDEIEDKETKGHLWHLRYPRTDGKGHVVVATTRPETMLGDTGVAVHPDDARYKDLVGRSVELPLAGRTIPVVADDTVDPAFGSGAVKVTPGHDFADYERGQRHGLPILNIMNLDGTLNAEAGAYAGLDRAEARKRVVSDLEALGLLEKIEDHVHNLPLSDRSKSPIEPLVSEQWFVKMEPLAQPAIRAVKDGTLRFQPERWTKVYLDWLENVRDWCISRQLWWGHQIPVWYDAEGEAIASVEDLAIGSPHPRTGRPIVRRDEDVLDTWASSWLWPFSTLGWPQKTEDLARFYPTQYLATAREIIYLWVARMVMAGYEFLGQCPFDTVYINATVLDEQGRRMSKSLGNGIDPRDMIEQYGADAVRFTLLILTTDGQDVKLSPTKFELGRNFMNKIWNAARYVLGSVPDEARDASPGEGRHDRWILSRRDAAVTAVTEGLAQYRYSDAAHALYRFVWDDFCDWYLEASKARIRARDLECGATLLSVLGTIVRLAQPMAPYLAAELAQILGETAPAALLAWPKAGTRDAAAEADMERLQGAVRAIRNIWNEYQLPPGSTDAYITTEEPQLFLEEAEFLGALAPARTVFAGTIMDPPAPRAVLVLPRETVTVPLSQEFVAAERTRKQKELEEAQRLLDSIDAKLANENFTSRAKPEVVERERQRRAETEERLARIRHAMSDLGA